MNQISDSEGQPLWALVRGVPVPPNGRLNLKPHHVARVLPATAQHLAQAVLDQPCQHRIASLEPVGLHVGMLASYGSPILKTYEGRLGCVTVADLNSVYPSRSNRSGVIMAKHALSDLYAGAASAWCKCYLCHAEMSVVLIILPT